MKKFLLILLGIFVALIVGVACTCFVSTRAWQSEVKVTDDGKQWQSLSGISLDDEVVADMKSCGLILASEDGTSIILSCPLAVGTYEGEYNAATDSWSQNLEDVEFSADYLTPGEEENKSTGYTWEPLTTRVIVTDHGQDDVALTATVELVFKNSETSQSKTVKIELDKLTFGIMRNIGSLFPYVWRVA